MLVICGEALIDLLAKVDANGMAFEGRKGGSPFNVAVGLARLGRPVSFLGALSSDALGTHLRQALEAEGVSSALAVATDAPTTLALVALDAQGVPSYSFYGTHGADRQLTPEGLPPLPAATRAVHVGSYATVVEPTGSALRALVDAAHTSRVISYDPNVRLNVEPSRDRWREQVAWMLPRTHLLKVSEEDLHLLFPGASMDALASEWLAAGLRLLVITRGASGASAWTRSARVDVPAVRTVVVDTVGAGDSFQSALLAWLDEKALLNPAALASLDRASVEAAVGFAMAAAAITCSRAGADLPRREEVLRALS